MYTKWTVITIFHIIDELVDSIFPIEADSKPPYMKPKKVQKLKPKKFKKPNIYDSVGYSLTINIRERLYFIYSFDYLYFITIFFFFKKINNHRSDFRRLWLNTTNFLFVGYLYIWKHIKLWVPSLLSALLIVYYSLVCRLLPFLKIMATWFIVFMLFYWLISGFVFFTKRYKYGKFTSAIQRFWRRSLILFWLVESSLFIVFIYLMFNASQEPVFMYDLIQLQKYRLFSWRFFIYKSFLIYLTIMLTYILMVSIKWNIFAKMNYLVAFITFFLTYTLWIEFYQFFYVLNWYGEICWFFDVEDRVWYAESVFKRARIVNHYVTICIIAKFWHIVFIYIFWIFFLLRFIETNTFSYVALSSNLQNFIFLYVMNWLLMYPWLKKTFRKFLGKNYSSLNEYRKQYISGFIYDYKLFIFEGNFIKDYLINFFKLNFPYAFEFKNWANYGVYTKHYITSVINNFLITFSW